MSVLQRCVPDRTGHVPNVQATAYGEQEASALRSCCRNLWAGLTSHALPVQGEVHSRQREVADGEGGRGRCMAAGAEACALPRGLRSALQPARGGPQGEDSALALPLVRLEGSNSARIILRTAGVWAAADSSFGCSSPAFQE